MLMVSGLACHKVDRDGANLCAIEHDLEVLGRGVLSAISRQWFIAIWRQVT